MAMSVPPAASDSRLLRDIILQTALDLGEQHGWNNVHLHDVAQAAGTTLAGIRRHFQGKDALAEAWFDQADEALLAAAEAPGWMNLSVRQRLYHALLAWLEALAPHRALTAQMLRYKVQPEHLHLQALGLIRISRTVQWWREAGGLPSAGLRREAEEGALTMIYLSTFACWLQDDSGSRASVWLDSQLAMAEWLAERWR